MESIEPLVVQPPLRILGVIASPSDQEPVDIEREQAQMKMALAQLLQAGLVELTWLNGQTWQDIQAAMTSGPWHILHFIGHLAFDETLAEGALALALPQGRTHLVHAAQLGRLLVNHDTLRLVILYAAGKEDVAQQNACFDIAETLTERGIPAVFGALYKISERAALVLTSTFYTALAQGLQVDAARAEARTALVSSSDDPLEWEAPFLYQGKADSRLFVLPDLSSAHPAEPATIEEVRGIDFSKIQVADVSEEVNIRRTLIETDVEEIAEPTSASFEGETDIGVFVPRGTAEPSFEGETDIGVFVPPEIAEALPPGQPPTGHDESSTPDATIVERTRSLGDASPAEWSYPPGTIQPTGQPSGPQPYTTPTEPGSSYGPTPSYYPSYGFTSATPGFSGNAPGGGFPGGPVPTGVGGGAAPPLQSPEMLQFTAFYPRQVPVKAWNTLLVYTHIAQVLQQVQTDAARFEQELGKDRRESAGKASIPLLRGTTITIVPACPGVTFNPSWFSFAWVEDWHRTTFRFQASPALMGAAANGEITIFSGPLIIGTIKLAFLCEDSRFQVGGPLQDKAEKARLYQQVFSSYSHQDKSVVVACRNAYKALGMDVLIDIDSLRSGQDFSSALMRLIDTADIFQLFWSPRSAQSDWVRREWVYALQERRGEGFIRPVYWEEPMPPPPPELGMLHFTYMPLPTLEPSKQGAFSRFFGRK